MNNEYLVAKYIASPTRMEPRNIGVFVRTGDSWRARFLGESAESKLDLRKARPVVDHPGSYQQWVEYWRHILQTTQADEVKKSLEASSKVNFIVTEGQSLFLGADAPANPDSTLEYLYHLIVTEFPEPGAEELNLNKIVEAAIRRYGLRQNPHFSDSPNVRCEVRSGVIEHVRPHYGYCNGREVYIQRVSINPAKPEAAQKEVHNAAWIFQRLSSRAEAPEMNSLIKIVRTGSVDDQAQFSVPESMAVLNTVSNVVDVEDDTALERVFAQLAA